MSPPAGVGGRGEQGGQNPPPVGMLRREELDNQRRSNDLQHRANRLSGLSLVFQLIVSIAAITAAWGAIGASNAAKVAAEATREGVEAAREGLDIAQEGNRQQAYEDRLATAIDATGGDDPSQKLAGFALLSRQAEELLAAASAAELTQPSEDLEAELEMAQLRDTAFSVYVATVDIFENYFKTVRPERTATSCDLPPGGRSEAQYVVNYFRKLMDAGRRQAAVLQSPSSDGRTRSPGVDLANVYLGGAVMPGIDFSWLNAYMPRVDLRGAVLSSSRWGGLGLSGARFQCADLSKAVFVDTDLRDANLTDARFTGACATPGTRWPPRFHPQYHGIQVSKTCGAQTAD